uniref:NADP-dependent oxidoreductase domain-containing protein n=1 Tax=Peronospora matthiolae TaxID=2874970 RepID=A0AAV1U806_9STRA
MIRTVHHNVWTVQCARLHIGRATALATNDFVRRSPYNDPNSGSKLRASAPGVDAQWLHVGPRGIGSSDMWAKDMPRINMSNALMASYTSNFIQTAVNPVLATRDPSDKQAYVEALVLNETMQDAHIPRECFVISTLIGSNVLQATHNAKPEERLTKEYVEKGVAMTRQELDVETVDHVVCQIPEELLARRPEKQREVMDKLKGTCDVLEAMCDKGTVQSYGFSLPMVVESSQLLEELVDKTLTPLSEQFGRFASLQLSQHVGSALFPLPESVMQFRTEREMFFIGDRPLEAMLSSGNPFHLKTYETMSGEEVALQLKTAFNFAIAVEEKYAKTIRPENEHPDLPSTEEVAWAHVLANQCSQFDNLQVWIYVRETQIAPRLDATLKQLNKHKETKELGFAYLMAMKQLLKYFTKSVELEAAARSTELMAAWKEEKGLLPSDSITIEEVAVMAALSAGMDIALLGEQLPASSSLPFTEKFSFGQLQQAARLAKPHFIVA